MARRCRSVGLAFFVLFLCLSAPSSVLLDNGPTCLYVCPLLLLHSMLPLSIAYFAVLCLWNGFNREEPLRRERLRGNAAHLSHLHL